MKQSLVMRTIQLFLGNDVVRIFSFKVADTRGNYVLLAKKNDNRAVRFALVRDCFAHISSDCFECLLPYKTAV